MLSANLYNDRCERFPSFSNCNVSSKNPQDLKMSISVTSIHRQLATKARPSPRLSPHDSISARQGVPWDFRYAKMRNADPPSTGTSERDAHGRRYSIDRRALVDALSRARAYRVDINPHSECDRDGVGADFRWRFNARSARERSFRVEEANGGERGKERRKRENEHIQTSREEEEERAGGKEKENGVAFECWKERVR